MLFRLWIIRCLCAGGGSKFTLDISVYEFNFLPDKADFRDRCLGEMVV